MDHPHPPIVAIFVAHDWRCVTEQTDYLRHLIASLNEKVADNKQTLDNELDLAIARYLLDEDGLATVNPCRLTEALAIKMAAEIGLPKSRGTAAWNRWSTHWGDTWNLGHYHTGDIPAPAAPTPAQQ